jgi:hypothetical protein
MVVPFQSASRHRRRVRLFGLGISLMVAFGLVGLYVNLPPIGPPGVNPSDGSKWKICPECGEPVDVGSDTLCTCPACDEPFEVARAEDYS